MEETAEHTESVPESPAPDPAPADPAPAEPASADPEPASAEPEAPAKPEGKPRSRTGFFDKIAIAPFYLTALVVGWGVAWWLFAGYGFACPSWLRTLALCAFAFGAVWSIVFRERVAKPVGYVAGCVALFVLVALLMPHGTFEERTARQKLDEAVAKWRAQGYDLSVASFAMDEREDGSYAGQTLLRSGRQIFEMDLEARPDEKPDGYQIVVRDLDPATNERIKAMMVLARRLSPAAAAEDEDVEEDEGAGEGAGEKN